ncbi:hypothetical protein F4804DRAFT_309726 [Jackrogersella minutella]|nr:hypothetical protein F4804DRAFT_309726 [Jackrogersella minutella]
MSTTAVVQGYCVKCRHLLSHWPDLPSVAEAYAVGRSCYTDELEAATRSWCKFCSFLLSRLKVEGLLDTFRKIENRLRSLNTGEAASLTIQNWSVVGAHSQLRWLNLPGKVSDNCNSPGSTMLQFESRALSPTGKVKNPTSFVTLTIPSEFMARTRRYIRPRKDVGKRMLYSPRTLPQYPDV